MSLVVIPAGIWEELDLNCCVGRSCADIKNRTDFILLMFPRNNLAEGL
jgi:hypothetical protein